MSVYDDSLKMHAEKKGKLEVISKVPVNTSADLSLAYTPGVAQPCLEIEKNADLSYVYTSRANMISVISDGSAVLGLGNIGALASMPVMEGKCVLFKTFGNVDAFPIVIDRSDPDEMVDIICAIAGSFGGINLEDISAPRCFYIERKLKEKLDIPIFHDDQHGTAVVALAAIINAYKIVGKKYADSKVVIAGAGAAGNAIARLLTSMGFSNIILCDRKGAVYAGREGQDAEKELIAAITNPEKEAGDIGTVIKGADIFLGVSAPGIVTTDMVKTMNKDAIVFPMSNPTPEIFPDEARAGGARIIGTGRSDFPNQINNVLAFPGIFRGTLDARASDINEQMKIAAAYAIANAVPEDKLSEDFIIPTALDREVPKIVARDVYNAAVETGVARI